MSYGRLAYTADTFPGSDIDAIFKPMGSVYSTGSTAENPDISVQVDDYPFVGPLAGGSSFPWGLFLGGLALLLVLSSRSSNQS